MMSRLKYILTRIGEAGVSGVFVKVKQKLRPYMFWPEYALARRRKAGQYMPLLSLDKRRSLETFGKAIRDSMAAMEVDDPDYAARVQCRAEAALGGSLTVLGYGEAPQPKGTAWHEDPFHGYKWDKNYFPKCDFLANHTRCDVKVPWELSRMQWLVWLAEAYALNISDKRQTYADAFSRTLKDWTISNPTAYGVNWTCGMDVAIRAVNLVFAGSVLLPDLDDDTANLLTQTLSEHLTYLHRFPEVSDVPGNHYLADLLGEVVLTGALYGFSSPQSREMFSKFTEAADIQFEPDGAHLERSTVYHRLTLDIVAPVLALALKSQWSGVDKLQALMQRAASFNAQIVSESGKIPVFGDQDSGFVLWFGERAQYVDPRLCGLSTAPQASHVPTRDFHSLLATLSGKPLGYFPQVKREYGAALRSGFATVATPDFRLTLKTGDQGLLGRAPHDHEDALSVWVSMGGQDIFVDAGCHSYTLDPALRYQSIVSSAHNVLTPFERERFEPVMGSVFVTARNAPIGEIEDISKTHIKAKLSRLPSSSLLTSNLREINFVKGSARLEISDEWTLTEAYKTEIRWRIDPNLKLSCIKGGRFHIATRVEGAHIAEISLETELDIEAAIEQGDFSPDYGCAQACDVLRVIIPLNLKGKVTLILQVAGLNKKSNEGT